MSNLDDLLLKLKEVAKSDDVLTEEEDHIINHIRDFIQKYNKYLEESRENGGLNTEQKSRLNEMRKEVLEGAWVVSMEDGNISDDESELISAIYDYLKNLELD